jgi:hypothetical protein
MLTTCFEVLMMKRSVDAFNGRDFTRGGIALLR